MNPRTPLHLIRRLAASLGLAALFLWSGGAAAVSLTGQITTAGTDYSIGQLQAMSSFSQTVGGDTYVGVSLWSLLGGTANGNSSMIIASDGNTVNRVLRNYLVLTGAGGAQSLVSAGEISPVFGGNGLPPYLVAYQKNGVLLDAPTLIVPQDATGTRNLAGLTGISVQTVAGATGPGGQSTSFTLTGAQNPYNLAALQALPTTTVNGVTYSSAGQPQGPFSFTGVSFTNLLDSAGLGGLDARTSYVIATGSDGYKTVYSLAELDSDYGLAGRLVAYEVNGSGSLGTAGFARTVLPGDLRGGRYVSNLTSIEVVATVPEPEGFAMLGAGLALIVLVKRRRERGIAAR